MVCLEHVELVQEVGLLAALLVLCLALPPLAVGVELLAVWLPLSTTTTTATTTATVYGYKWRRLAMAKERRITPTPTTTGRRGHTLPPPASAASTDTGRA